jgi:hypothetical protein
VSLSIIFRDPLVQIFQSRTNAALVLQTRLFRYKQGSDENCTSQAGENIRLKNAANAAKGAMAGSERSRSELRIEAK